MFERSWVRISVAYGHFLHLFIVKIVFFVRKDQAQTKKRPRLAHLKKTKSYICINKFVLSTILTAKKFLFK